VFQNQLKVVVAEDDADSRAMMVELLSLMGCDVIDAPDAEQAIEACRDVELAFIDIGLPDADGYSVATAVRKTTGKQPKLVAVTGYVSEEARLACLNAGFDAHMAKPVSFDQISRLLTEVREQRRA
jgi:CheY-like chemotaxis protein